MQTLERIKALTRLVDDPEYNKEALLSEFRKCISAFREQKAEEKKETRETTIEELINARGSDGKTPIEVAAEIGNAEIFKTLLEEGAKIDVPIAQGGKSVVQSVLERDNASELLNMILFFGTQSKDPKGNLNKEQISSAVESDLKRYAENAQKIANGMIVVDSDGNNSLHSAIASNNQDKLRLLKSFFDINLDNTINQLVDNYVGNNRPDINKDKIKADLKKSFKSTIKEFSYDQATKRDRLFSSLSGKGEDILEFAANSSQISLEWLISISEVRDRIYAETQQSVLGDEVELQSSFDKLRDPRKIVDICVLSGSDLTGDLELDQSQVLNKFIEQHGDSEGKINDQWILRKLAKNCTRVDNNGKLAPENYLLQLIANKTVNLAEVLLLAVEEDNDILVGELLSRYNGDIDLDRLKHENGRTPLEEAIINGRTEIAMSLIESNSGLLSKINEKTGETVLHLVARSGSARNNKLAEYIASKLDRNSAEAIWKKQDNEGKTAAQIAFDNKDVQLLNFLLEHEYNKLPSIKGGQIEDMDSRDFHLFQSAAKGHIDDLKAFFERYPDSIYKVFDDEKNSSILEVAAENNQGGVVRFIISEHKKLHKKRKDLIFEMNELGGAIKRLQDGEEKSDKESKMGILIFEFAEVEERIGILDEHINKAASTLITKQSSQPWHNMLLQAANKETLRAAANAGGALASKAALLEALKSGNDIASRYFAEIYPDVKKDEDVKRLLTERGDLEKLLEYGIDTRSAYENGAESRIFSQPETQKDGAEQTPSAAELAKNIFKHDLEKNKGAFSRFDILDRKGVLTPYANALQNSPKDVDETARLEKALSDNIKDKDNALVDIRSDDGHSMATLIAAFGTIAQWQKYQEKYNALNGLNKPAPKACDDNGSSLGTPAQAAVLAKKFAANDAERGLRFLFIDGFLKRYKPDLALQNQDGENLLHTVAKCSDIETLDSVFKTYSGDVLYNALATTNSGKKTPLKIAIEGGDVQFLQNLDNCIKTGLTQVQYKNLLLKGNLLHTAILHQNSFALKLFLHIQKAFDGSLHLERQKDKQRRDPFVFAMDVGNVEAMQTLASEGFIPEVEILREFVKNNTLKPDALKEALIIAKFSPQEIDDLIKENNDKLEKHEEPEEPRRRTLNRVDDPARQDILNECKELAAKEKFQGTIKKGFRTTIKELKNFENAKIRLKDALSQNDIDAAIEIIRSNSSILNSKIDKDRAIDLILANGDRALLLVAAQNYNHALADRDGNTFLHRVAELYPNDLELIDRCLGNGASLSRRNRDGKSPQINADLLDNIRKVLDVIRSENATSLNKIRETDPELLALCQLKNQQDELSAKIIKSLGENLGMGLSHSDENIGELANLLRRQSNYYITTPVITKLLANCFKPDALTNREDVLRKRFELLNRLIKKDIPLTETDGNGNNIFHQMFSELAKSSSSDAREQAKKIIESIAASKNFDRNLLFARNQDGDSPLQILMKVGNPITILEILKERFPGIPNSENLSDLLICAAVSNNTAAISFLVKNYYEEIHPNNPDKEGKTALLYALLNENFSTAEELLKIRADINQADKFNRNLLQVALDMAYQGERIPDSMISFLVRYGISLTHKDNSGLSVLDRVEGIDKYKNKVAGRINELSQQGDLNQNEKEELKRLNTIADGFPPQDYAEIIKKAQKAREAEEEQLKLKVQEKIRKAAESKFGSFLYDYVLPSGFKEVKLDDFHCSKIGCELYIKTKDNASVQVGDLMGVSKGISVLNLDFNDGRDKAEVVRHPEGYNNYTVKEGSIRITTQLTLERNKKKEVVIKVDANGDVCLVSDSDKKWFEKHKNKIIDQTAYLDGEKITSCIEKKKWKSPNQRQTQRGAALASSDNAPPLQPAPQHQPATRRSSHSAPDAFSAASDALSAAGVTLASGGDPVNPAATPVIGHDQASRSRSGGNP